MRGLSGLQRACKKTDCDDVEAVGAEGLTADVDTMLSQMEPFRPQAFLQKIAAKQDIDALAPKFEGLLTSLGTFRKTLAALIAGTKLTSFTDDIIEAEKVIYTPNDELRKLKHYPTFRKVAEQRFSAIVKAVVLVNMKPHLAQSYDVLKRICAPSSDLPSLFHGEDFADEGALCSSSSSLSNWSRLGVGLQLLRIVIPSPSADGGLGAGKKKGEGKSGTSEETEKKEGVGQDKKTLSKMRRERASRRVTRT